MRGCREERIENLADCAAAAALAVAVAASLFMLLSSMPQRLLVSVVSAALAYVLAFRFLRSFGARGASFVVPHFTLPEIQFDDVEELLLTDQVELFLTDADLLKPRKSIEDELILDDILARLGTGSRVVRLFDPDAMPTPAQLNRRIEQHLHQGAAPAAPGDDSQALYEALTQLRRSLR